MTSLPLLHPPLAAPNPSCLHSASTPPLLPLLHSNSKVYLHNLYNYVMPTLRLTMDQYQTHSDLVPMPRATAYIPFLHFTHLLYIARLKQNEKTAFFSFLPR